eukprot:COSAG05_NODE_24683_length_232_cov_1304.165414_1_plen_42_part_10
MQPLCHGNAVSALDIVAIQEGDTRVVWHGRWCELDFVELEWS